MLLYKKFGLQLNRKSVNCRTNRTKFSTRLQINSSRNGSHTAITDINRLNSTQKIARLNHIQVKILSEMMFLFHSSFSFSVRLSSEQRGDILTEICFVSICGSVWVSVWNETGKEPSDENDIWLKIDVFLNYISR